MNINLIILAPTAFMLGFQYFEPSKTQAKFDFNELNIYLAFFQLQIQWNE
jgi:uncharacterized protein involved in cysteine biosynthesis